MFIRFINRGVFVLTFIVSLILLAVAAYDCNADIYSPGQVVWGLPGLNTGQYAIVEHTIYSNKGPAYGGCYPAVDCEYRHMPIWSNRIEDYPGTCVN